MLLRRLQGSHGNCGFIRSPLFFFPAASWSPALWSISSYLRTQLICSMS